MFLYPFPFFFLVDPIMASLHTHLLLVPNLVTPPATVVREYYSLRLIGMETAFPFFIWLFVIPPFLFIYLFFFFLGDYHPSDYIVPVSPRHVWCRWRMFGAIFLARHWRPDIRKSTKKKFCSMPWCEMSLCVILLF